MISPVALLLSLRPQHAEKVLAGSKTVELRRTRPRVRGGDSIYIYVSSPIKALVGICEVEKVIYGAPHEIWEQVQHDSGVTKEQFDQYYDGAANAYAISLKDFRSFPQPLELERLREGWSDFWPPQIYRYLTREEINHLAFLTA